MFFRLHKIVCGFLSLTVFLTFCPFIAMPAPYQDNIPQEGPGMYIPATPEEEGFQRFPWETVSPDTGQGYILPEIESPTAPPGPLPKVPYQPPGVTSPDVPDFISGAHPSEITKLLPRFGYSFFNAPSTTFTPLQDIPVGPDYILGPGDSLRVSIWGFQEGQYTLEVDRNGNISLPGAGVIGVAGLTFEQAKWAIEKAYSQYFTNFEINVTMGQLRTITIYVVGHANHPGAYSISSLSTIINGLIAAGGPGYSGTLRNIKLKRNDRVVSTFDSYELLLKGNKKNDKRLMPGDVIFIPPVGPLAGITGDIKKPAYYELKGNTRLSDLVEMAGGFTSSYFRGRVQIDRTMGHEYRTAIENDLKGLKSDPKRNVFIQNGDLVKVFPVHEKDSFAFLSGAISRPGRYAIQPGSTRVGELLRRAGGPLYMASDTGEITRVHATQAGPQTERFTFNVERAINGDPNHDLRLELNDYITVRTVPEWDLYRTVRILGEVRYPGIYSVQKGERLSDLLERAGGYTSSAFLKGAYLARKSVMVNQRREINKMLERLETSLYGNAVEGVSTALFPGDAELSVLEREQRQKFLTALRQVKPSGRMVIKLPDNYRLLKGTPYDVELEQGDSFYIPKPPESVNVVGSVFNPTSFTYRPNQKFTEYIKQAGGYSINADQKRVYLVRADGTSLRAFEKKRPLIVKDGDTIVVPEKIYVKSNKRDTAYVIDMLYKLSISVAVVTDAFND